MTRIRIEVTLEYHFTEPTELLLAVEAATTPDQHVVEDRLFFVPEAEVTKISGGSNVGTRCWTIADGAWRSDYGAVVDVDRHAVDLATLESSALATIPADVIPFLWPSRYCEADRFWSFVDAEFARLSGGALVLAIVDWVRLHLRYTWGSSTSTTTAVDTFVSREGVCRDYAHLVAALVRARDIPARLTSVYAWGLAQPDFHAVVEVWLDGAWHIVDATGLAPVEQMVRIATGRDATDIAFMTAFGRTTLVQQSVSVKMIEKAT